jgi:hypothetical protein
MKKFYFGVLAILICSGSNVFAGELDGSYNEIDKTGKHSGYVKISKSSGKSFEFEAYSLLITPGNPCSVLKGIATLDGNTWVSKVTSAGGDTSDAEALKCNLKFVFKKANIIDLESSKDCNYNCGSGAHYDGIYKKVKN